MKRARRIASVLVLLFLCGGIVFAAGQSDKSAGSADKKLKVGFIYIGPAGDFGWTYAHEQGRQYVMAKYDWLESVTVESVPEGESIRYIDRLVQDQKCDMIITTSFGYMDGTLEAAEKYPDTIFMHCSGFKTKKNLGTYMGDLYQIYYLNGLMAGAMTEADKVGYVGAFPIPELFRHMNAFALGIKEVNPDASVYVKWINAWYGPDKAKEAAEALVAEGCDVLGFTEDTPAVVEVGQSHTAAGKPVYTLSHYSPMQSYGEDSVISGQLIDWGIMYEKMILDVYNGTWESSRMVYLMEDGAAKLGGLEGSPINEKFIPALKAKMVQSQDFGEISVYDLVMKRHNQMKEGRQVFDPYKGPITDQAGTVRIEDGVLPGFLDFLDTPAIQFYVDNFVSTPPESE